MHWINSTDKILQKDNRKSANSRHIEYLKNNISVLNDKIGSETNELLKTIMSKRLDELK
jgi:hypothetical protein